MKINKQWRLRLLEIFKKLFHCQCVRELLPLIICGKQMDSCMPKFFFYLRQQLPPQGGLANSHLCQHVCCKYFLFASATKKGTYLHIPLDDLKKNLLLQLLRWLLLSSSTVIIRKSLSRKLTLLRADGLESHPSFLPLLRRWYIYLQEEWYWDPLNNVGGGGEGGSEVGTGKKKKLAIPNGSQRGRHI